MAKIVMEIPEEILHDKKTSPEEKGKLLLKMAAMELYKQTDSSHGFCAKSISNGILHAKRTFTRLLR